MTGTTSFPVFFTIIHPHCVDSVPQGRERDKEREIAHDPEQPQHPVRWLTRQWLDPDQEHAQRTEEDACCEAYVRSF